MADVLVRLIDLVYELLDRDIVLRSVVQALVKSFLQSFVGILLFCEGLLLSSELLFEACYASVLGGQVLLSGLQAGRQ